MRWIILFVLFLARTTMSYQFQSVASAAPYLIEELRLTYAEVGVLIGMYLIPGTVLALPSGLLQMRFGDKAICSSGLLLMALGGAVLGFSDSYGLALLGRVVSGAGAVLLNLVIAKMVSDWFVGREISFAMGSVAVSWGVGISIGLLTQGPIASSAGRSSLMYFVALACVLALALVLIFYRPPPGLGERNPTVSSPQNSEIPGWRISAACLVAGAIWGMFNAGLVNYFSFAPEYLAVHGLTSIEGATLTSLTLWVSILFVPLSGYFVHLARRPDLAICVFSVLTGLALLLLATIPSTALAVCIIAGLVMSPPIGAILALPARVAPAEQRGVALGLFYSSYYILATIGPPIAGALRDMTGNQALPVLFAALLFMVIPIVMIPFWTLTRYSTLRG